MENKEGKTSELRSYIRNVKSISPSNSNFEDLQFLKEILKNKEIILLGEQLHSDGSTFLAKARLIKFLHEELNFDVLIFETGLYDTYNLWNKLKMGENQKNSIFSEALYDFWYKNEENKELLSYILKNKNTNKEIDIAGLDVQFSGKIKNTKRDSLLSSYLQNKSNINSSKYPSFYSIKKKYYTYTKGWIHKKISKTKKDSILFDIESIVNVLEKNKNLNKQDSLYLRFFKNLKTLYTYSWKHEYGSNTRFHIRDSAMADNFIWLKEKKFKNRKVIVWASNFHIAYDNYSYNPIPFKFTSMGEYIKKEYKEKCYSINFTSYTKNNHINRSEDFYNNKSIEYLFHKIKKPYLYLDFNTINDTSFLHNETIMNLNQGLSFNANWNQITDAVFYIDNMKDLNELKD